MDGIAEARTPSTSRRCRPGQQALAGVIAGVVMLALWPVRTDAQTTGSISGTVTNANTGAPIQGVRVTVQNATFSVFRNAITNAAGVYVVGDLPPDTYVASTSNDLGYVNEIYDNVSCAGFCESADTLDFGVPIAVTAGSTAAARDFALDPGGEIAGTVRDAGGTPLPGVDVFIYTTRPDGRPRFVGSERTDTSGAYTVTGLAAGQYVAFTAAAAHVNEIYDNILCPGQCPVTTALASGLPIPVAAGATAGNRNFSLATGGSIAGVVRDAVTDAPIGDVLVTAYARIGGEVVRAGFGQTDGSGAYRIDGLPTGTYSAYTQGTGSTYGYADELFGGVSCLGYCPDAARVFTGGPIAVTAGSVTEGRDFALSPGGRIAGVVTDEVTGLPLAHVEVEVAAVVGSTWWQVASVTSDADGTYQTRATLPAGSYVAGAFNGEGYLQELYDDVPCVGEDCPAAVLRGEATPVPVTGGDTTGGIDFALSDGGRITGTITDAGTGQPLAGVEVTLYLRTPAGGVLADETLTSGDGSYMFPSLVSGTYVAFVSRAPGYVPEIYDDVPCADACDAASALGDGTSIPVTVGLETGNIDVALSRRLVPAAPRFVRASVSRFSVALSWTAPSGIAGGMPTGYVLEAGPTPGAALVTLPVSSTAITVPGVPPGRYYVRVRGVNGAGAGPASEEVIVDVRTHGEAPVEAPQHAVAFMSGGRLTLSWAAPPSGAVPAGYLVEAGSSGGLSNIATLPVASRSFTFEPVPPGVYFLRVRARTAWGIGPASNEVMIVVGGVPVPPDPPVNLAATVAGTTVSFTWEAPATGEPTSYRLEAGTASGLSNAAVFQTGDANTSLSFPGVPRGRYYVRLRAVNAAGAGLASNEVVVEVP